MKKIAIIQSNYIPWRGYFDIIAGVDEFILYDEMQYTRRDWRNRNLIKTPQGQSWLTIPVISKGKYFQRISETKIDGRSWAQSHWKTLFTNYQKSKHFKEIAAWLEPLYCSMDKTLLVDVNRMLIKSICNFLEIETKISNSYEYKIPDGKNERLISLCLQSGADEYISGPSARGYLQEDLFVKNNIKVTWFDYSNYKKYPQLWGEFTNNVTILDLLFNCGKDARQYLNN